TRRSSYLGGVAYRVRHLEPVRPLGDLRHLARDVIRLLRRIERHERGHPLGDVVRHDHAGVHVRVRGRLLRGEHDVLVVRQDHDRPRVGLADRAKELLGRGVHRRAATQYGRTERPRDRGEAVAGHDGDDPDRRGGAARRGRHDDARRALVLGGHRVEILDDDVRDAARGEADADDLVRLERVDVDLYDGLVADDEDAVGAELEHLLADLLDGARRTLDEELDV